MKKKSVETFPNRKLASLSFHSMAVVTAPAMCTLFPQEARPGICWASLSSPTEVSSKLGERVFLSSSRENAAEEEEEEQERSPNSSAHYWATAFPFQLLPKLGLSWVSVACIDIWLLKPFFSFLLPSTEHCLAHKRLSVKIMTLFPMIWRLLLILPNSRMC